MVHCESQSIMELVELPISEMEHVQGGYDVSAADESTTETTSSGSGTLIPVRVKHNL
jgi:hypothetical protein